MKPLKLMFLILTLVGLGACSIADKARSGLRPLDEQNALLTFTKGPFAGPASHRLMYADPEQREEYALFKSSGRVAEVVYITTRHLHLENVSLDNWGTLEDMVSSWNYLQSGPQFDTEAFWFEADWIGLWVKPFARPKSNQRCAGFRGEWDIPANDPDQQPSKMIFGYFCEKPGAELGRAEIEAHLTEMGVRGISTKLTGDVVEVAAVPKQPSQSQLAASVQNGPFGTREFPYLKARFYGTSPGCPDGDTCN